MTRNTMNTMRLFAVAALLSVAVGAQPAQAQAVDATLTLAQPAPGVSHTTDRLFDTERPRVALVISEQARSRTETDVRDAVYSWEVFLLGLQLPYETLQDGDVAKGLSRDLDLVIMPAADALSGKQRKSLRRFVERGGSVIVSGALGQYDERGRDTDDTFFADFTGSEYVTRVPQQPFGLLHSIDAASPVGQGVPPGFRLNIAAMSHLGAARPVTAMALGTPYSYSGRDDGRLADLSLMVLNQLEDGHVLWTRFGPQHVSRERAHQAAYQRMMANAMAFMSGSQTVSVRPWPEAARSALAVAALPTVGFDPLAYLAGYEEFLGLLRATNTPATFFPTSDEAIGFPDITRMMAENGEIAVSAESDDVLLGQPLELQASRLARSSSSLGGTHRGVYPPGGYHDGNTLRAAVEGGFNYTLLPGGNSLAPYVVRWWEDVDYRALRGEAAEVVDLAFLRSRRRQTRQAEATVVPPTPAAVMPLDTGMDNFVNRFMEIERAGGLYVLPFYPESERAGSNRSGQLRDVLTMANERGAWAATLNDVLRWWTQRNAVSVNIAESASDLISIDVVNGGREVVHGLTLELRLGDVGFDTLEGDASADLIPGDTAGTYLMIIDRLPTGSSRFTLNLF